MTNHSENLRRWASQGWEAQHLAGGHIRLRHPNAKEMIVTAKTPSDWRAVKNTETLMRRMLPQEKSVKLSLPNERRKKKPVSRPSENFSFETHSQPHHRRFDYVFVEKQDYEPELNYIPAFAFMILRMRVSGHDWDVIRIQKSRYRNDPYFRKDVIERLTKAETHEYKKLRAIFLANAKARQPKPIPKPVVVKPVVEAKPIDMPPVELPLKAPKPKPVAVKTKPAVVVKKKIEPAPKPVIQPSFDDDQPYIPDDYLLVARLMMENK